MTTVNDRDRGGVDRRTALTLMAGAAAALNTSSASPVRAQAPAPAPAPAFGSNLATDIHVELKQLAPNAYAFIQQEGPGQSDVFLSNCGVVVGADSLMAIDTTAAPAHARKFLDAAKQATGKPFRRAVITHPHIDHFAGMQFLGASDVIGHDLCRTWMVAEVNQAKPNFWGKREGWADGTEDYKPWLVNQTYSDKLTFHDYGEGPVQLIYPGYAHTVGDTMVYLPQQKILFAGDIAFFKITPLNRNGYIASWIKACDMALALDVETIVPGHGPIGGKAEMAEMRDYLALLWNEGKKRYDAGVSAGRAAAEIDLGKFKTWADSERILPNIARLYSEFDGSITPEADNKIVAKARADFNAAKGR